MRQLALNLFHRILCFIGTDGRPFLLCEKGQLWRKKSTMGFSTTYRWSAYVALKPPKCGSKSNFYLLGIKFNFNRIKSATKFLCVKTSSSKVVV